MSAAASGAAAAAAAASSSPTTKYYRADGVRITHDPYAPGMAAKYGAPGQTDGEGFDPYRDSVGAGIYGGVVKRDSFGAVVIGAQYQNHNPTPGPVYANGGYTPMANALGNDTEVSRLLDKWPDLVNDVATGGAQPLHMCGMSASNQRSTALLIAYGGDIEALDTYGMTPLHRMASNNLPIGAQALLDAGADPTNRGEVRQTALEIARSSAARDVIAVLKKAGDKRRLVPIVSITIAGSGASEVNTAFFATEASEIPLGFATVCETQGWETIAMWTRLNANKTWFKASNGAYIYFNASDECWWIDAPSGEGVYKAQGPAHAPPQLGWTPLGLKPGQEGAPAPPQLVATFRNVSHCV